MADLAEGVVEAMEASQATPHVTSEIDMEPIRALVPYAVMFFSTVLIQLLRKASLFLPLPTALSTIVLEFLATLELIAACAELDVVYELHGPWAYGVVLFMLCYCWGKCWCGAEACPSDPIEGYLLDYDYSLVVVICRLIGQFLAAKYTYGYIQYIWSYELMPQHTRYLANGCDGSIQVTILKGGGIEGLITFISRIVALNSGFFSPRVSNILNSATTVILVLSAATTTGGFFNPVLAAGLKFGCQGMSTFGHVFVFWISSMAGGLVARYLHLSIKEITDKKFV